MSNSMVMEINIHENVGEKKTQIKNVLFKKERDYIDRSKKK